jgi:hypothetical protein
MKDDGTMLAMLRARGATIGPTAKEQIDRAIARAANLHREAAGAESIERPATRAKNRSTIRRMKSQTEKRFAARLDAEQADGLILRWRYEAVRFQLAEHDDLSLTYTPDFVAWLSGGRQRFFEVKSRYKRDSDTESRARFINCRQQYGDENHEFVAYREEEPGNFLPIWERAD